MPADPKRVQAVFLAAVEAADPAACAAVLARECGADAELRRRVEALLVAHGSSASLLDGPALAIGAGPANPMATFPEPRDSAGAGLDLNFLQPSIRPDSLGRLGRYEILEVLGRGGFGIVFRAFDESLERVVAVKVLAPQLAATSPPRKRFLREARSSAKVRHENVVQVHAVEEQPLPHIVMEFIPGETLQQRLDRIGPLDTEEAVKVGRQIAEGLAAAHSQGLIHRDVKPANVLIEAGPHQWVKLTDFGLARAADDASLTQSGLVAGTPMFMSPEQATGETLDHRADLFSLGSVLYTMCSGRPPFRANSMLAVLKRVAEDTPRPIREVIPEVPQWLCGLIARLHAKKPEDRFASAQEVADLLGRHLAQMQRPENVPPVSDSAPALEKVPARRNNPEPAAANRPRSGGRQRWAVAAAVLLLLLGGLGVAEATGVTKVRGMVIRLFSPEGTLVVEVDDPGVSVTVDDEDVVITGAGAREIRLKPGKYTVQTSKDGKVVSRELVTVEKNGRRVVRVSQEPAQPSQKKDPNKEKDSDRRAAEYVLSIGGKVRVNEDDRDVEKATQLPREPFRLTVVIMDYNEQVRARVTDEGLANFEGCKHLTHLHLPGPLVSDAGLAHFKGCKHLTYLTLAHAPGVRGEGLANFADCKNLTHLNLIETRVGDAGVAHFKGCKNLTHLNLARTQVSDAGLANFKDCKNLSILALTGTKVSDKGLAHFEGCKDLTWLFLGECAGVSDAGVAHFKGCTNLGWLALDRTNVSDKGLAHFEGCKNLSHVQLNHTRVSDEGLAKLADCKNLTTIVLQQTKVTQKVIDLLKKALPKCRIEWDEGVIEPR